MLAVQIIIKSHFKKKNENKIVWWSLIYLKTWQFYFLNKFYMYPGSIILCMYTGIDKWHFQIIYCTIYLEIWHFYLFKWWCMINLDIKSVWIDIPVKYVIIYIIYIYMWKIKLPGLQIYQRSSNNLILSSVLLHYYTTFFKNKNVSCLNYSTTPLKHKNVMIRCLK
jgi:hypothetical protein